MDQPEYPRQPDSSSCNLCDDIKVADTHHSSYHRIFHKSCTLCPIWDSSLCSFCQHMRISHLLNCLGAWCPDIKLGLLQEVCERGSTCRFCRFVSEITTKYTRTLNLEELNRREPFDIWFLASKKIGVRRQETGTAEQYLFSIEFKRVLKQPITDTMLLNGATTASPAKVEEFSGLTNWDQVKSWMASVTAAVGEKQWPTGLKLIDVETNHVVRAPSRCSYMSLSYVWGSSKIVKLSHSSCLSFNELPRTIHDAIIACRKVQVRYLWVDQICIDQDDEKEVQEQIKQMHLIYHNAQCALVALAGKNADYGLPGVTKPCDFQFSKIQLGNSVFADHPLPFRTFLGYSKWFSRGWTFQELLFSPNVLFFTQCGTFFQQRLPTQSRLKSEMACDTTMYFAISPKEHYENLLELYMQRQFTYPGDILKGFTAALQAAYGDATYHGLPLQNIHEAILWLPYSNDCSARDGFPSWSWTSHSGRVRHIPAAAGLAIFATPTEAGKVEICKPGGSQSSATSRDIFFYTNMYSDLAKVWLAGCIKAQPPTDPGRPLDKVLRSRYYSTYYQLAFPEHQTRSIFTEDDLRTLSFKHGRILIHSQTAYLKIGPLAQHAAWPGNNRFLICSSRSKCAGIVAVPLYCQPTLTEGQTMEFLALSLGIDDRLGIFGELISFRNPTTDPVQSLSNYDITSHTQNTKSFTETRNNFMDISLETPKLNVMLISRDSGTNISRRLGVGCIYLPKWVEAEPQFKTMVLQ